MVETKPLYRAYIYDKGKRRMHIGVADKNGNEKRGPNWRTSYISDEIALVKYDVTKPVPYRGTYTNQLDEEPGEVQYIESPHGMELVTDYDAKNPAKPKLPKSASQLSQSIRNN